MSNIVLRVRSGKNPWTRGAGNLSVLIVRISVELIILMPPPLFTLVMNGVFGPNIDWTEVNVIVRLGT